MKRTFGSFINEKRIENQITLRYVLTNERYMGDALLQKQYTTDTLPYRRKYNKGEKPRYYVENSNPSIVSRETFNSVQKLLKSRQKEKSERIIYPLSSMIKCPECGKAFRRQVINGTAYWQCNGRSTGATNCKCRRVREDEIYEAFTIMIYKLKDNHNELLGTLINQLETMRSRTNINQERIHKIDKEIADLSARNIVVARLYTSQIIGSAEYCEQSSDIENRIRELRIERRKKLAEDENEELIDSIKLLNRILDEYIPTNEFDNKLFEQIIEGITVNNTAQLTFRLIGGIELTEIISEKGRCKSI